MTKKILTVVLNISEDLIIKFGEIFPRRWQNFTTSNVSDIDVLTS